jgi:hypothetical protein
MRNLLIYLKRKMDLLEILKGQLDDNLVAQLSEQIGAQPEQTVNAAQGIFASLLGGLAGNAQKPGGLEMLSSVLDRDHDGSILDDVMGMVLGGQAQPEQNRAVNGAGMLRHILGDRQEEAAQHISQSSGLNMSQIMKLMPILAPIVMGVLGKSKSQGNLDLGDLAGILIGGAQRAQEQNTGGGLGDLLGSVLGGVLGGNQQPPAQQQQQQQQAPDVLGGLLRGIFGK